MTTPTKKEQCAGCDATGTLVMEMKSIPFYYVAGQNSVRLTPEAVPVWRCKKCGFSFTGHEAEVANERAVRAYVDVLAMLKKYGIETIMRSLWSIAIHFTSLSSTAKTLRGRYLDAEFRGKIGKTFDEWLIAFRRARDFGETGDLDTGELYRWLGPPDTWAKKLGSDPHITSTPPVNDHE